MASTPPRLDTISGVILGTAVGDALGLPREGLGPARGARIFGRPPLRHRFVLGRGMISDDTEHTCLVGQALLAAPEDPRAFARSLAWRLRGWLLALPAGVGFATLRSILKLFLGFPPHRSGVFSAGNGPAMRAPLIGVCLGDTPALREHVRLSTRITHTDPRAEQGAFAVALAAALGSQQGPKLDPEGVAVALKDSVEDPELRGGLEAVRDHLQRGSGPRELASQLGLGNGVTGYVNHTVPASLFCWLRTPGDFRRAVEEVVSLGGDTDTTGAVVGGLAGATVGVGGIPMEWLEGLLEWPRSVAWMSRLARQLGRRFPAPGVTARDEAYPPVALFWPGLPLRNLVFLLLVLGHGLRRALPPY